MKNFSISCEKFLKLNSILGAASNTSVGKTLCVLGLGGSRLPRMERPGLLLFNLWTPDSPDPRVVSAVDVEHAGADRVIALAREASAWLS